MHLKEWQYSLCTRFATQLLPPESFATDASELRKQALEFGLHRIEFDTPQSVQTELGLMQVFIEKPEVIIAGETYVIPEEHRYILGHIIDENRMHLFEKISQVREPAQEKEHFIRIETLEFDPTHTSAVGLAMRTHVNGVVTSMGYRHYWGGEKFELIDIARSEEEFNISIDRHFDRNRKSLAVIKDRKLQVHVSPEDNQLAVEIDNQKVFTCSTSPGDLSNAAFVAQFSVGDPNSFFYTQSHRSPNTVIIENGIASILGAGANWQTNLLGATFTNETTYQQLLPINGPDILSQEIQRNIHQFVANQHHINLEGSQVVLM